MVLAKDENSSEIAKKPLRIDPRFKYEVMKSNGGDTLRRCFQCGTCTSSCPVARFSGSYRPREIIRMAQLGLSERIFPSDALWLCAACFTCVDRCPQDVEVASVLRVLRNMAVKKGYLPEAHKELATSLVKEGYAYRIPAMRIKKRKRLGLPPLPRAAIGDMAKMAKATKFLGYAEMKE
jgi:heterodisulfide reductase subunit C